MARLAVLHQLGSVLTCARHCLRAFPCFRSQDLQAYRASNPGYSCRTKELWGVGWGFMLGSDGAAGPQKWNPFLA